jgi:FaeA-like protein
MGDRFLFARHAPIRTGQFERALKHVGAANKQMRREMAEAVHNLFAVRKAEPRAINKDEVGRLDEVISLVVRLRGPVERDRHTREIEAIHGAEGTARIGLMLERLLAGLDVLGVERERAMTVVETVAKDSVPPLRRAAYDCVQKHRDVATADVAIELGLPTNTVRRVLEDLAAYQLVERQSLGKGKPDHWVAPS